MNNDVLFHEKLHFLSPLSTDGKCTIVCVGLCLIFISRRSGLGSLLWLADVWHLLTLFQRSAGKDEVVFKAARTGVEGMWEAFKLVHASNSDNGSPKLNLKGSPAIRLKVEIMCSVAIGTKALSDGAHAADVILLIKLPQKKQKPLRPTRKTFGLC